MIASLYKRTVLIYKKNSYCMWVNTSIPPMELYSSRAKNGEYEIVL